MRYKIIDQFAAKGNIIAIRWANSKDVAIKRYADELAERSTAYQDSYVSTISFFESGKLQIKLAWPWDHVDFDKVGEIYRALRNKA